MWPKLKETADLVTYTEEMTYTEETFLRLKTS